MSETLLAFLRRADGARERGTQIPAARIPHLKHKPADAAVLPQDHRNRLAIYRTRATHHVLRNERSADGSANDQGTDAVDVR